jgi:hypothetical protein
VARRGREVQEGNGGMSTMTMRADLWHISGEDEHSAVWRRGFERRGDITRTRRRELSQTIQALFPSAKISKSIFTLPSETDLQLKVSDSACALALDFTSTSQIETSKAKPPIKLPFTAQVFAAQPLHKYHI